MSECPHELWERESAVADGYCPLCQAIDLRNLRVAVQPTEPVVEALRLILPLAKGYVAAHPIESNIRYVHAAEAALAAYPPVQPTEPV